MIVGEITIKINYSNKKHFINKGYDVNINDIIIPKIEDINKGSHVNILCECDNCKSQKNMEFRIYYKITNGLNDNYYCNKCSYIKNKKTNLEKYGVEHPMKNINVVNKLLNTNNIKYGKNSASMNKNIKEKQKRTNLEKYGVEFVQQNKIIKNKSIITNLKKYGVEHPMKNINIKNKTINTKIIKYNNKSYNNRNKSIITNLEKYGFDNPSKNEQIKDKINKTKIKTLMKKYPSIIKVDYSKKELEMICDNGYNHHFIINMNCFKNRKSINTTLCTLCNNGVSSGKEIELINFIKNNYNDVIIQNDRKILNGKELDIYLPDLNLAFEFNGLYWHNELNKPNNYHKIKTDICNEKGIQLIHIYEDDWIYKQKIVKSMILNKLNKTLNKIYGRKTKIKEIKDNKLIRNFLEENHIQGFIGSSIKIGLFYNNELVSLMTFGKLRKPLNNKSSNDNYEMLRFCNKLNTNVAGGASKLFKYFIKNYNPKYIISYADRSYSNGNLYKQLEFKLDKITIPNYYYIINGIKHYRFGFRKDILVKQGFNKNKTEHQIMIERKIYRIYNSGNYKFILS